VAKPLESRKNKEGTLMDFPMLVKNKLTSVISEMALTPELFVKNPDRDFIRNRKLKFGSVINLLLSMGGNSLGKELLDYFNYDSDTASTSAFIQQRNKILPSAFKHLLDKFTGSFDNLKTHKGYRLLAVDGSDFHIYHNPNDAETYFNSYHQNGKGYNLIHLNAMYDLCNKLYIDACIQPRMKINEYKSLCDMVDNSSLAGKALVIADRGYESYNVFAHIEQKGWKYVIRVKDTTSRGILSNLNLPKTGEFDENIRLILTNKSSKEIRSNPQTYRVIPSKSAFNFFELKQTEYIPIEFRVVRFKTCEDNYQTVITNVAASEFSSSEIKHIYHLRWGIETSFRELKYVIGLNYFHSKKVEHIYQEVFARLVMYNFCELITLHVIIKQKATKYGYQANFTLAMQVCKYFFRSNASPPDVEALIKKNILPIREERKNQRNIKQRSAVSFNYRVA